MYIYIIYPSCSYDVPMTGLGHTLQRWRPAVLRKALRSTEALSQVPSSSSRSRHRWKPGVVTGIFSRFLSVFFPFFFEPVCFVCILFHRDSNADHWGLKQSNPRGVQEDKMGILANHGGSRPAKMPRQAWASRFDYQTRRAITLFPDSVRVTAGSQELMSSAAWDRMSLQPAEDLNSGVCRYCGQK